MDFYVMIVSYLPKEVIMENTPTITHFKTASGHQASTDHSAIKISRHLNNTTEDTLLNIAFRYLFHLNVARETKTPFEIENLRALAGNRLIKQKHPFNLFYDFQFVAAKTQIKSYLHNTPVTMNYNRRALRIYGRCFLFAQLDYVAQTGIVPEKLTADFYFLPKGTFIDEFERMNKLALAQFIPELTSDDAVQFHPTYIGEEYTTLLLNDTLVLIDTDESMNKEKELQDILAFFLRQKAEHSESPQPFTKIGIYRARFGEMVTLDIEEFFEENLDRLVK